MLMCWLYDKLGTITEISEAQFWILCILKSILNATWALHIRMFIVIGNEWICVYVLHIMNNWGVFSIYWEWTFLFFYILGINLVVFSTYWEWNGAVYSINYEQIELYFLYIGNEWDCIYMYWEWSEIKSGRPGAVLLTLQILFL